jgi:homogentisate 1,2-dioxygenase
MPIYHKLGLTPHKRHIVFRQPDGKLYHEELIGTEGFLGNFLFGLSPQPTYHGKRTR